MKLFLINSLGSIALGWAAVLVCIALNFLRRRESPNFFGATIAPHSANETRKPWPLWLKIALSPVYGTLLILLAWMWIVLAVPSYLVLKMRRLAFASHK